MKKSKEETARSRQRILQSAARRFRAGGFAGVSVKELMGEAGLTHGAFYAHFPSKEALMGAACTAAFGDTGALLERMAAAAPDRPLDAFFAQYLSQAHVEHPERGCAVPTLAPEAGREGGEVATAFSAGITGLIDRLAEMAPGDDLEARRAYAVTHFAEAVGTLVLARAVEPGEWRDRILEAVRADLIASSPQP